MVVKMDIIANYHRQLVKTGCDIGFRATVNDDELSVVLI
jgi:hypothetical protein